MDPTIPEPPESPRLLRPRTVGELLTDAFELYRRHWQNLFVIVAVIVIPLSFLQVLVGEAWIRQGFTEEELRNGVEVTVERGVRRERPRLDRGRAHVDPDVDDPHGRHHARRGRDLPRPRPGDRRELPYGFARFWSIVLVGLLSGLAIAVGFLLLIVPGFIVLTFLSCAIPALVIEGKRGREALRRSWSLVRGRGWPVFGTIIVATILTSLVNSLLTSPFGDNWAARSIGASIASILTMPYMALVGCSSTWTCACARSSTRRRSWNATSRRRDLSPEPQAIGRRVGGSDRGRSGQARGGGRVVREAATAPLGRPSV
jgi:hypothetical protein